MTNTTAPIHIARTRRLVAVAASLVTLGGFGAVAIGGATSTGANPAQSRPAIAATPTATTAAPAR